MITRLLYSWFKKKTLRRASNQMHAFNKSEFQSYKPMIEFCFKKALYWHGTGRYHYSYNDKYQDYERNPPVEDTLMKIVEEGGLLPKFDPWVSIAGKHTKSISTTRWRMYARTYAELHNTSEEDLKYTFGSRKDIIKFFLWYTLFSVPTRAILMRRSGIRTGFDKKRYAHLGPVWAKTINNTLTSKGNAFSDLLHVLGRSFSNIPGNHGILFGISSDSQLPVEINPIIRLFEERFTSTIGLKDITHIEVPLRNVTEVTLLLKRLKRKVTVLPMEYCELFARSQGIRFGFGTDSPPLLSTQAVVDYYTAYP